ncbi:MAG: DUF4166 domain-containing protein [Reyranella sp.]|nr:DUF4166 domain-containing protein [Reyranella sp.]
MAAGSLYRRVLGAAYAAQSAAGQALHDAGTSRWTGSCSVEGGATPAARLVAALFRLPAATSSAPITVEFVATANGERWTRRIGSRALRSWQFIAKARPGWIAERFGIFTFDLELLAEAGRLQLLMRGMRCWGLPLPRALWPRIAAGEWEEDGRFRFDVEIALPAVGRLVRYRGWLTDR